MIISGTKAQNRATPPEVAEATIRCLKQYVPESVPGIAFLSGGQTSEEATEHLNLMNKMGDLPWELSFSYGRAMQASPLKTLPITPFLISLMAIELVIEERC